MNDSTIICDKVRDADAKLSPNENENETKTIPV